MLSILIHLKQAFKFVVIYQNLKVLSSNAYMITNTSKNYGQVKSQFFLLFSFLGVIEDNLEIRGLLC